MHHTCSFIVLIFLLNALFVFTLIQAQQQKDATTFAASSSSTSASPTTSHESTTTTTTQQKQQAHKILRGTAAFHYYSYKDNGNFFSSSSSTSNDNNFTSSSPATQNNNAAVSDREQQHSTFLSPSAIYYESSATVSIAHSLTFPSLIPRHEIHIDDDDEVNVDENSNNNNKNNETVTAAPTPAPPQTPSPPSSPPSTPDENGDKANDNDKDSSASSSADSVGILSGIFQLSTSNSGGEENKNNDEKKTATTSADHDDDGASSSSSFSSVSLDDVAQYLEKHNFHVTWVLHLVNRAAWARLVSSRLDALSVEVPRGRDDETFVSLFTSGGDGGADQQSDSETDPFSFLTKTPESGARIPMQLIRLKVPPAALLFADDNNENNNNDKVKNENDQNNNDDDEKLFSSAHFPPFGYHSLCTDIPSLRSQVVASLPSDRSYRFRHHDFDSGELSSSSGATGGGGGGGSSSSTNPHLSSSGEDKNKSASSGAGAGGHQNGGDTNTLLFPFKKIQWPLGDIRGEEYSLIVTRCIWSNVVADAYADLDLAESLAQEQKFRDDEIAKYNKQNNNNNNGGGGGGAEGEIFTPVVDGDGNKIGSPDDIQKNRDAWTRRVFATKALALAASVKLSFNISLPSYTIVGTLSSSAISRLRAMFLIEVTLGAGYLVCGIGILLWSKFFADDDDDGSNNGGAVGDECDERNFLLFSRNGGKENENEGEEGEQQQQQQQQQQDENPRQLATSTTPTQTRPPRPTIAEEDDTTKSSSTKKTTTTTTTFFHRQPKFLTAFYHLLTARGVVSVFSTLGLFFMLNGARITALEFIAGALDAIVTLVEICAILWLVTGLGITRMTLTTLEVQVGVCVMLAYLILGGVNAACATHERRFDVIDLVRQEQSAEDERILVSCDTVFLAHALLQNVAGLICFVFLGQQVTVMLKLLSDPASRSGFPAMMKNNSRGGGGGGGGKNYNSSIGDCEVDENEIQNENEQQQEEDIELAEIRVVPPSAAPAAAAGGEDVLTPTGGGATSSLVSPLSQEAAEPQAREDPHGEEQQQQQQQEEHGEADEEEVNDSRTATTTRIQNSSRNYSAATTTTTAAAAASTSSSSSSLLAPHCTVDMWLRLRDFRWPFLIVALLPILRAVGQRASVDLGGSVLLLIVERMTAVFTEMLVLYYFFDVGSF